MDLNPTEVLKALQMAQGDVSFDGTSKEYPAVLADAVRKLSFCVVGVGTEGQNEDALILAEAVVAMEGE